ncbi:hypothetical protein D3C78_1699700 [compost metagenome]
MATCSDSPMPADVAAAPTPLKASAMSLPVVLNICTASAVCPARFSTHSALPMASAWPLKIPYMVPT